MTLVTFKSVDYTFRINSMENWFKISYKPEHYLDPSSNWKGIFCGRPICSILYEFVISMMCATQELNASVINAKEQVNTWWFKWCSYYMNVWYMIEKMNDIIIMAGNEWIRGIYPRPEIQYARESHIPSTNQWMYNIPLHGIRPLSSLTWQCAKNVLVKKTFSE